MSFIVVAAAVAVGAVFVARHFQQTAGFRNAVREVAEALNLTLFEAGAMSEVSASGKVNGVQLSIHVVETRRGNQRIRETHVVATGASRRLTVGRESGPSRLKKLVFGDDVEIGVTLFDDLALIDGPATEILARFNAPTREVLAAALKAGVKIKKGEAKRVIGGLLVDPIELRAACEHVVAAAGALSGPPALPRRLGKNATEDPVPEFRRRCLEALISEFPNEEWTRKAVLMAAEDEAPSVRFLAARAVGLAARPSVIEALKDRRMTDAQLADGVACLLAVSASPESLAEPFALALAHARTITRLTIFEASLQYQVPLPAQFQRPRAGDSDRTLARLCEVIVAQTPENGERTLTELLELPRTAVGVAAAKALAAVGTVAAVPALSRCVETTRDGTVKAAARDAVRSIQGRATGPRGGLSLAHSTAGQLAVVGSKTAQGE